MQAGSWLADQPRSDHVPVVALAEIGGGVETKTSVRTEADSLDPPAS
jgi:hypothetical protein